METNELLKKVRKIEIKTKGLSQHIFSGQYHSAFKGRGMAFSEVREYAYGDDVRSIDWNVTARFDRPYIKVFEEERELTVILLIDVSSSNLFGTQKQFKQDLITEIAAVLAFSAIQNNDKVGVIFFSDQVEKYIPPKKGRSHILRIIRELLTINPVHKQTNIGEAMRFLNNVIKKRCTAFVLSDFFDNNYEHSLKIVKKKHDVIALRVYDERETELPNIGLMRVIDQESNREMAIDTSVGKNRNAYKNWWLNHEKQTDDTFKKFAIRSTKIRTDEDYVRPLTKLFLKR
ncbi:MAG: DUF58 domain-containing protein [Bacteroidales bacterium]|jgi:uncharacterized protein (DUF58 family)|nr:DUF58 domain-containing protein [Bacteroidales bacterium]